MIVIVESGSTKADWMLVSNGKEMTTHTQGFNPHFLGKTDILEALQHNELLQKYRETPFQLYFYGAGCSEPKLNSIIEDGLQSFFHNAMIVVHHDLYASALACYEGVPEIACILGTGSNSCYFAGKEVEEKMPSLGYILGDEGSGNYFGKRILADFLYKKLPQPMHNALVEMGLNKSEIISRVYNEPNANVFIGSIASVLIQQKDLDYSQALIREGIQAFLNTHVKCYASYKSCEINFVGSIAALLETELRQVCLENEMKVGRVVRRPLERLVRYHLNKIENL